MCRDKEFAIVVEVKNHERVANELKYMEEKETSLAR